jgi:uncharacterized membrane protein YqhA
MLPQLLQAGQPIIVRVVEQPVHETTIADIILGAIGLVGILLIAAALLGLMLGGALIGIKFLRARRGADPGLDHEELRVTPTS